MKYLDILIQSMRVTHRHTDGNVMAIPALRTYCIK